MAAPSRAAGLATALCFLIPLCLSADDPQVCESGTRLRLNVSAGDSCVSGSSHRSCPVGCRAPASTSSTALCIFDTPPGWGEVACQAPPGGLPWATPWARGGQSPHSAWALALLEQPTHVSRLYQPRPPPVPESVFPGDLPGPLASTLHVAAYSTLTSKAVLNCWMKWVSAMITSDERGRYELHVRAGKHFSNSTGGEHWLYSVAEKIYFVEELLDAHDSAGNLVIGSSDSLLFTDLDVLPLGHWSALTQTHDMMFMQAEDGFVNTGFYLVRNNAHVREFIAAWAEKMRKEIGSYHASPSQDVAHISDQIAANYVLRNSPPVWDLDVWDRGLDGQLFGQRCAAIFNVPRSTARQFRMRDRGESNSTARPVTRCAAVHAINAGRAGARKKLRLLSEAWGVATGTVPTVDVDSCVVIGFDESGVPRAPPSTRRQAAR